jgi:hypothetical protein
MQSCIRHRLSCRAPMESALLVLIIFSAWMALDSRRFSKSWFDLFCHQFIIASLLESSRLLKFLARHLKQAGGREWAITKLVGGRRLRLPLASLSVLFVSRQDSPANAHRFVRLSHEGLVRASSIRQALQPEAAIILLAPTKLKHRPGSVNQ